MKSFYTLFLLLLVSFAAQAQPGTGVPEQECINGIPVCASGYNQTNSYVGYGETQELNGTNQGCLGSAEKNDVWYLITVSSTGTFNLNITPNDLTDDYDFALWDISANGCQDIYNGAAPVACNYSGTPGITGLNTANANAGQSQWSPSITVTAGQVLAMNVSNFSSTQSGYQLDFDGSTAQFVDTVRPYYKSTVVRCGTVADSVDVIFSEPIACTSIAADGSNFSLSPLPPGIQVISARGLNCVGATKYSRAIRIKFSGTLPAGTYTLSGAKGTNNSYLEDACNNDQTRLGLGPNISIDFTMNPPGPPVIDSSGKPACTHITVKFSREVKCKTIAPDGSDFFITGPSPVAITHADVSKCGPDSLIKIVDLHFDKSIETPGAYVINFKQGTDGNGIVDTCNATVVKPYRFDVADTGAIATANPEVLCEPGYATLSATVANPPYGALVRCGTGGGPDLIGAIPVRDTIGTFADTTDGVVSPTFFDGSQANVRTQILYSAAELQAAGLSAGRFKSVSFFVGDKQSFLPFRNLNIKMGCVRLGALSRFEPNLPVVYSTPSYATQEGENKFNLTNAYDWDGRSDVLVEICYSNPVVTLNNYDQLVYTPTPANTFYRRASNLLAVSGCALADNSGTGGAFDTRPTLAFDFQKPPVQDYHWLWLPSNYVEDSTSQTTLAFVPAGPRQYIIQAKDQYGCYRRATTQVDISIRNPYGYPANDTTICTGGTAQLLVGNGVRYQWFPAEGLSCTDCPNPTVSPTETTTYYAAIFDQYGCSDTLSATVQVNTLPVVNAGSDTSVLYSYGVPLYVQAPGARYYAWTPTDGLNYANVPNPVAAPLETTQYVVQVIDTNYCIAYDTVLVTVRRDVPVGIPNGFTPNGDNRNDVFRVVNLGINKLIEMRIFNRWGTMVCNTTDNARGWDGTYQGVAQDAGVYKYLIRVAKPDGTTEEFKGDLNLLR